LDLLFLSEASTDTGSIILCCNAPSRGHRILYHDSVRCRWRSLFILHLQQSNTRISLREKPTYLLGRNRFSRPRLAVVASLGGHHGMFRLATPAARTPACSIGWPHFNTVRLLSDTVELRLAGRNPLLAWRILCREHGAWPAPSTAVPD
jgi:hypothetical protein